MGINAPILWYEFPFRHQNTKENWVNYITESRRLSMLFQWHIGGAAVAIMATPCQSRHCGLCFAGIFQDFPQDFSWNKREMGFNQAHRTHDKDQTLGKANQNFWLFLSPILAETTAHFSVGSRSYITAGCCSRRSSADTDNTRMIIGHPQLLQSI